MRTAGGPAQGPRGVPHGVPPWVVRLGLCWRDHFGTLARGGCTAVAAALIVHSLVFVYRYHLPMAFWDFWNWVEDYRRYVSGQYHFIDLFDQHNEHRIVTTRLFLFADALWFHMSGVMPVVANLGLLAVLGVLLHRLASRPGASGGGMPCAVYVACMMSVCQWENLVAPFQIQFALLLVFVTLSAMCLAQGGIGFMVLGLGCFALAAFSMASGVLAAPVLLLMMVLRRAAWPRVVIFAAGAAAIVFLYFHHYTAPPPLPQTVIPSLALRLRFAAGFMGSALAAGPDWAQAGGMILLGVAAVMLVVLARQRWWSSGQVGGRDAVLLAIAGFSVSCAAAAAMARAGGGLPWAFAPRYGLISLWCGAACVVFTTARAAPCLAGLPRPLAAADGFKAGGFKAIVLLCLLPLNVLPAYARYAADLRASADHVAVALRANVDDGAPYRRMDYEPASDRAATLRFLHDHHLNMFAPAAGGAWYQRRFGGSDPRLLPLCDGGLDYAAALDPTRFVTAGVLFDRQHNVAADHVVAMTQDGQVLGAATADVSRPALRNDRPKRKTNGFRAGFAYQRGLSGADLWLVGTFAGDQRATCGLKLPPLGDMLVQRLPQTRLPDLPTAWAGPLLAPFAPGAPADAHLDKPWPEVPFLSSAAAGDAATGALAYQTETNGATGAALVLPYATGPDPKGQVLTVTFRDGVVIAMALPRLAEQPAWRAVVVPGTVIAAHGGGAVRIVARDDGSGWGQWLAIARPVRGAVDLNGGRLF